MRRLLTSLTIFAVGLVTFAGGSLAPASAAVSPDAAKGFTRVAIDPDVLALLETAGITVMPTGKATAGRTAAPWQPSSPSPRSRRAAR